MSASTKCEKCRGTGVWDDGNNEVTCPCVRPASFDALHAICHERDFVVRVNDPTVNFANRILCDSVGPGTTQTRVALGQSCSACNAGYRYNALQPNARDRN